LVPAAEGRIDEPSLAHGCTESVKSSFVRTA
jgi:hypothetical protein